MFPIRKLALIIMVTMSSDMVTFSATIGSGFYRVHNFVSDHFLFVRDCTGSINSSATQDLDAIELRILDDNIFSDPSSIIYLDVYNTLQTRTVCDIASQNTGIYKMVNKTVTLFPRDYGTWQLYYGGSYLYDVGGDKNNLGTNYDKERTYILGTTIGEEKGQMPEGYDSYSLWGVNPVNSNSTDNYFGFKPTVSANGKLYTPFFAAFAYTPTNSNIKTWYVSKVDKSRGIAVISEITGTVAKSQPVIIECVGTTAADNKVNLTTATGNSATSNLLKGTYFCNGERAYKKHTGDKALIEFNTKTMRVLGTDSIGNLAFVSSSSDLTSSNVTATNIYSNATTIKRYNVSCIPHNHSYLTVDSDCPATLKVMTEAEYANIVPGDVNNDCAVNTTDAVCIVNYYLHKTTDINVSDADMNKDGDVNTTDAVQVINKYLGK